ncbi:hypothetical protein [Aeromonas caviae]|uniref:hypothetical protein n=1 Tax=Aeromonas caviae TaxID=648 RepID=UPI002B47AA08|nr:hypothetical protein [Aeromonas caviae]
MNNVDLNSCELLSGLYNSLELAVMSKDLERANEIADEYVSSLECILKKECFTPELLLLVSKLETGSNILKKTIEEEMVELQLEICKLVYLGKASQAYKSNSKKTGTS